VDDTPKELMMHGHGRELLEVVIVGVIAVVAAVWYFIGRESANKPPPESK